MSITSVRKTELIEEYSTGPSDTGSPEVQVAILSERILNLTDGSEKKPGEGNRMVIECLDDQVKVWVNGDFVNHGSKCTAKKGKIAIQAEGSEVEFRKFDLTPINALTE